MVRIVCLYEETCPKSPVGGRLCSACGIGRRRSKAMDLLPRFLSCVPCIPVLIPPPRTYCTAHLQTIAAPDANRPVESHDKLRELFGNHYGMRFKLSLIPLTGRRGSTRLRVAFVFLWPPSARPPAPAHPIRCLTSFSCRAPIHHPQHAERPTMLSLSHSWASRMDAVARPHLHPSPRAHSKHASCPLHVVASAHAGRMTGGLSICLLSRGLV